MNEDGSLSKMGSNEDEKDDDISEDIPHNDGDSNADSGPFIPRPQVNDQGLERPSQHADPFVELKRRCNNSLHIMEKPRGVQIRGLAGI